MISLFSYLLAFLFTFVSGFCADTQTAGNIDGIIKDNTPKKYFTVSLDDGITQDKRLIEIMKKYNFYGCTFNINTGLLGESWEWVGKALNKPEVTHIRFTEDEIKSGIYDGYDLAVHTVNHDNLSSYDNYPFRLIKAVEKDAQNIYDLVGVKPVGMAYPGVTDAYTEKTIENLLKFTSMRFARNTLSTNTFDLPEYFMEWCPTASICDGNILSLAQQFIAAPCTENMLFYVWGHSYEMDVIDGYDTFEQLIKMITEQTDIVCVTNTQFYELFKDSIPSYKQTETKSVCC